MPQRGGIKDEAFTLWQHGGIATVEDINNVL